MYDVGGRALAYHFQNFPYQFTAVCLTLDDCGRECMTGAALLAGLVAASFHFDCSVPELS